MGMTTGSRFSQQGWLRGGGEGVASGGLEQMTGLGQGNGDDRAPKEGQNRAKPGAGV